jgi:hypothetical protein
MTVLADYTFGAGLLTVLEIFLFIAWIWVLITVIGDLFSDHSVSGWGKAGWCAVMILVPFLGVLIYLIARSGGMQERAVKREAEAKQHFDTYVRQTAAAASPADELTKLAALRDQGTLSVAEFEQAKAKVLVGSGGDGARIA